MADDPPRDPPPGGTDSERIAALETHQHAMDGKLDKILDVLDHDGGDARPPVTQGDPPPEPAAEIGEQMRQAVRDVAAEQAARTPAAPAPEKPPREITVKGKARLQRRLFGGEQ